MTKTKKNLKFEEAVLCLEELVEKLEKGELPLDVSLQVFEEGMELAKFCEQKLNEAEGKVETWIRNRSETKEVKEGDLNAL